MGQNLILNAADHGFTVCAYNRTTSKVDRFLDNEAKGGLIDAPDQERRGGWDTPDASERELTIGCLI